MQGPHHIIHRNGTQDTTNFDEADWIQYNHQTHSHVGFTEILEIEKPERANRSKDDRTGTQGGFMQILRGSDRTEPHTAVQRYSTDEPPERPVTKSISKIDINLLAMCLDGLVLPYAH